MDKKKMIKLISGVILVMLCGVLYLFSGIKKEEGTVVTEHFSDTADTSEGTNADSSSISGNGKAAETSVTADKIYIHVCGEVKKPGVYKFTSNPRVIEAVKKAGGFTKKADRSAINLAEEVVDGTQLLIPNKKAKKQTSQTDNGENESDKVNLNTATKEELMTLSGIGESKAAQILSYREENGAFEKIEDIMNISGIKEGVFGKIKNQIEV